MNPAQPALPLRPIQWLVAAALFTQTLDSTIVNTALPVMAEDLNESALALHGIVVAYSLTMALLIPASGWMADRFGTQRVFSVSLLLFALGSLLCALSGSLTQLILARIVQGMGGAMLMPVGRLTVLRAVPRSEFLAAMSFIAIPGLVGPLVGPSLGGWLVQFASWHWIFLINLPVCAVGLYMARRFLPDFRSSTPPRFDGRGYALLVLALLGLSFALETLSARSLAWHWPLAALLACLAASAGYWRHAMRRDEPIFPLSLFRVISLRLGLIGNVASRLGSGGMAYIVPLLLQLPLGHSPAKAGTMLIPVALTSIMAKRLVMVLIARLGYRSVLIGNTMSMGLCIMAFATVTPHTPLPALLSLMGLFGLSNSLQFTALNTLTLRDVTASQASSANTLLSVVQMSAISLGLASTAVILSLYSHGMGLSEQDPNLIRAFHASFLTMGAMTLASSAIFVFLPKAGNGPGEQGIQTPETGSAEL